MATPHVAGIAALLGEAFPKATPASLVAYLGRSARRLPYPLRTSESAWGRLRETP